MKNGIKILCAFLFLLAACRKESERSPCLETKDAALRVKVSQIVDTNTVDSSLGSPVLIPVGGTGTLRYSNPTTTLQLFLSPQADSCRYVFFTDSTSTLADTLFYNYTRQLRYISDACGYGTTFTLTSARATSTFIDSVLIRNAEVSTNVNSPAHVQMYLRP